MMNMILLIRIMYCKNEYIFSSYNSTNQGYTKMFKESGMIHNSNDDDTSDVYFLDTHHHQ